MNKVANMVVWAAFAGVSLAANAAYVTPWYVNPALKDRFWLGVDSFTPTGLAIGADATRLAIAAKPDGASDIIRVYDLGNLVYTANVVQTNRHVTAYTASAAGLNGSLRLVANGNDLLGVDAADSAAAKFTFESRRWIGRYAPEAQTFAAAPDATSFALDSTGALWSNATDAGREGLLVKRTLSGTAYAEADTVATGLTAVDAVAVYTVNGVEYALAAAQGKVVRVNVSTKAVATLVDDATHLDAAVKSVKMSHTDYFRPRLYVLLATGDIVVYYLDKTATAATWSKTLTNAELLTAAQAPYATTDAVIEAFEVTPDGGSAFLSYKANEGATATGPCTRDGQPQHGSRKLRLHHGRQVGAAVHVQLVGVDDPGRPWGFQRYQPAGLGQRQLPRVPRHVDRICQERVRDKIQHHGERQLVVLHKRSQAVAARDHLFAEQVRRLGAVAQGNRGGRGCAVHDGDYRRRVVVRACKHQQARGTQPAEHDHGGSVLLLPERW